MPDSYSGDTAAWNAVSRLLKWAAGSFIFCEAVAFREAGGFSEALPVNLDFVDSIRHTSISLRQAGRPILRTSSARIGSDWAA